MYFIFTKDHELGFKKGQIVRAVKSFENDVKGCIKEATEKEYLAFVKGIKEAKAKAAKDEIKRLEAEAKAAAKETEELRKEAEAEYKAELAAAAKASAEAKKEAEAEAKKAAKAVADQAEKDAKEAEAKRKQSIKDSIKADLRAGRAQLGTK